MQEESCNFSVVDVSSRHRKELKQLEGEKRAAVKKAKTTKGGKNNKAAKDEISA